MDFTTPEAVIPNMRACLAAGSKMVVGTTGWYDSLPEHSRHRRTSRRSSALQLQLFRRRADVLPTRADFGSVFANCTATDHITETHHATKLDAPSGTAKTVRKMLANVGAEAEITSHREGESAGDHTIEARSADDRIILQHEAFSRRGFAEGAVRAAEWLEGKTGVFDYRDIFSELKPPPSSRDRLSPPLFTISACVDFSLMSSLSNLQGCGTALVTPFRADGSLDEPALHGLVRWQIKSGIKLLIACGTTGETPTLSDDEWQRVIEVVVETSAGRVPVFAGCTHNSTREAVEKAGATSRIPGLAGLLDREPLLQQAHAGGPVPALPRDRRSHAICPCCSTTFPDAPAPTSSPPPSSRLAEIPNIIGIKESCGSLPQITELLTIVPPKFKVFAGDDNVALAVIGVGGIGLISVTANEIPAEMSAMVNAALSGDWIRPGASIANTTG